MNQRCSHTVLIGNQRCIRQRWFKISAVWYSTDSESTLYPTTLISVFKGMFTQSFLLWSNERCRIQRWFGISAVSNNADSELTLYPTALMQNQRCIRQHWFTNYYLRIQYLRKFETEFENILGCESGADIGSIHEKNQRSKISCYFPFKTSVKKIPGSVECITYIVGFSSLVCPLPKRQALSTHCWVRTRRFMGFYCQKRKSGNQRP